MYKNEHNSLEITELEQSIHMKSYLSVKSRAPADRRLHKTQLFDMNVEDSGVSKLHIRKETEYAASWEFNNGRWGIITRYTLVKCWML